jgi:DNA polymerase (family 10)
VHTTWSDGTAGISGMARAAAARGREYLGISDHSAGLAVARGLDPGRVREQWREIERLRAEDPGLHLVRAIEVDILADGRLDLPDEILARFDFVTASIHSGMRQDSETLTARLVAAIESPHVDSIGHPTGRMLGRRESYPIDLDRVVARASDTGTFLEINSQPARLDLDEHMARAALAGGARLVIGSDAHSVAELDFLRHGTAVARRAGARADQIATTSEWDQLEAALSAR